MLEWYQKYSVIPNKKIDNFENYINILSVSNTINNEDIIENNLNNIENEYDIKLKKLYIICENDNVLEEYKDKNSLLILEKELEIIKLLTKYALQNNHLDYVFFYKSLKYLFQLSEILRIRLNQKEIIHDKKIFIPSSLPRCSYKFCNYKESCSYNYNPTIKSQCYQDHYVHRMVSADLNILIEYIENKFEDNNFVIYNKEILKTINTLSFVINHMENELKAKCLYADESIWETYHVVKQVN